MHQHKQFLFAMTSLAWAKMVNDAFAWPLFNTLLRGEALFSTLGYSNE